jgi:lambda family phage minor tail protein L
VSIYTDIQTLEPGALVALFDLDARSITGGGAGDVLHFHGYTQVGPIYWQGLQYNPWPIDAQGFELNPDQPPAPTLSVGNVDGTITALCLAYQGLVGSIITRHRTFGRYLDAANFPGGNPTADPTQEFPPDKWFIERKATETKEQVQFELSSALDFGQQQLPGRQIIANCCTWLQRGGYRGPYCSYTGPAVAKADDTPTDDPTQDVCGGRLTSCELRWGVNNALPYGGYPAAGLLNS